MAVTTGELAKQLENSDIVSAAELSEIRRDSGLTDDSLAGDQLAKLLVKQGKLTKFQAQLAYSGKAKNLVMGSYVILEKLGEGGMGQVYKARHKRMKRDVAVKVLAPQYVKDDAALKRFHREVEAAARLQHPNIVTAYDANEERGTHYLVMEYVRGEDLSEVVKRSGPAAVPQAVNYVLQAARGLAFAHAEGIVHRDIKPSNLLLNQKGRVKILDMGLARFDGPGSDDATGAELTGTGMLMGTVDYMAPEQAMDSKTADHRADIYSLGCTLYFLLTGRPIYPEDTIIKRIMAHQSAPIPNLPTGDVTLQQLFERTVARKADDRIESGELVAALESWLQTNAADGMPDSDASGGCPPPAIPTASTVLQTGPTDPAMAETRPSTLDATLIPGEQPPADPAAPNHSSGTSQAIAAIDLASETEPVLNRTRRARSQRKHSSAAEAADPSARKPRTLMMGLGGLSAIILLSTLIFKFRGQDSRVVVDLNTEAEISTVEIDGTPVRFTLGETGNQLTFAVAPGTYHLTLTTTDGVELLTSLGDQPLTVASGGAARLRAWIKTAPGQADTNTVPDPNRDVAEWVLSLPTDLPTERHMDIMVAGEAVTVNMAAELPDQPFTIERIAIRGVDGSLLSAERFQEIGQLRSLSSFVATKLTSSTELTDEDIASLSRSPLGRSARLKHFEIQSKKITDDAITFFNKLTSLTSLGLVDTQITEDGLSQLTLPELQSLTLRNGAANLDFLSQWQRSTPRLKEVTLSHARQPITAGQISLLSPWQHQLETLRFHSSGLTDDSIAAFAEMSAFRGELDFSGNSVSEEGTQRLHKALPLCRIVSDFGELLPKTSDPAGTPPTAPPGTTASGSDNFALRFDGQESHVILDSLKYDGIHPLTIEAWVLPGQQTAKQGFPPAVVSNAEKGGISLEIANIEQDRWLFSVGDHLAYRRAFGSENIQPRGVHLAGVFDGTQLNLFVDGQPAGRDTVQLPLSHSDLPFVIGAHPLDQSKMTNFFVGVIDEVRLSSVARYRESFVPLKQLKTDEHTLALFHFNEGTGSVLRDSSGNSHHGKIIGAEWVRIGDRLDALTMPATEPPPPAERPATASGTGVLAPIEVRMQARSSDLPKFQTNLRPGQPLGEFAAVSNPGKVDRIVSWSIEPVLHRGSFRSIAVRDDGLIATGGHDGAIRLWSGGWELVRVLPGHANSVNCVHFSPDGSMLASVSSGPRDMLAVWDVATGQLLKFHDVGNWQGHLVWLPDGQTIVHCGRPELEALDALGDRRIPIGDKVDGGPVALSPDGQRFAVVGGGKFRVFSTDGYRLLSQTDMPSGHSVDWSRDGKWIAVGTGSDTVIYDTRSFQSRQRLEAIGHAKFSPDSTKLAVTGNGRLAVFRTSDWGRPFEDRGSAVGAYEFAWSPDSTTLITPGEFMDAQSGRSSVGIRHTAIPAVVIAVNADGTRIATITGDRLRVWNSDEGSLGGEFDISKLTTSQLLWQPDGRLLLRVSRHEADDPNRLSLVDTETGQTVRQLIGHRDKILWACWSPDGQQVASVGDDGSCRIWDAGTGKEVRQLTHDDPLWWVVWAPDRTKIATASAFSHITVWDARNGQKLRDFKTLSQPLRAPAGQRAADTPFCFLKNSNQIFYMADFAGFELLDVSNGQITPLGRASIPGGDRLSIGWSPDFSMMGLYCGYGEFHLIRQGQDTSHDVRFFTSPHWLRDSRRILGGDNLQAWVTGYDIRRRRRIGVLFPELPDDAWAVLSREGHVRGSDNLEMHVVVVALHEDGRLLTLTLTEFAEHFGWKNNQAAVRLLK